MQLRVSRCSFSGVRQRGAVAILVAVAMIVLLGFIGLAVDGGHLYLTKTELQNSADACALAASYELTTPLIKNTYLKAEAAGQKVASRNMVNFQGSPIVPSNVSVAFLPDLKAGTAGIPASNAEKTAPPYVRCTLTSPGISMFFMPLLGFSSQTVSSSATAGLVASQSSCVVPVGLCANGLTTPFGLNTKDSLTYNSSGLKKWIWIGINGNTTPNNFTDFLAGNGGACSVVVGTTTAGTLNSNPNSAVPVKAWNDHFGSITDGNGRLVVALIINCAAAATSNTKVLAFGCARMPQPLPSKTDNTITYEGLTTAAGSPCVGSGIPGGPASSGPMVPALVQ